jgi:hypothetical protein
MIQRECQVSRLILSLVLPVNEKYQFDYLFVRMNVWRQREKHITKEAMYHY